MTTTIEFQYKPNDKSRPFEESQNIDITADKGEFLAVPNVGDTVYLQYGGKGNNYKVSTRHYIYSPNVCVINIVVTDFDSDEMLARLKS